MTRVFRRGELKPALLEIVASLGEGHGYAIMQELQRRVGRDWQPSPGAIYPALLGLEEAGLLQSEDRDGLRTYQVTAAGRRALDGDTDAPPWPTLAERVRLGRTRPTLAGLLGEFQDRLPSPRRQLSDDQAKEVVRILDDAGEQIRYLLEQGEDHG